MAYRDQLYPWCIVRAPEVGAVEATVEAIVVARFRRRTDADAQLKLLRQMTPDQIFRVVFDRKMIKPEASAPTEPPASTDTATPE